MFGVFVVSMGKMRMMRARLVIAIRHMGGGFAMMLGGVFVMFGGMLVMFGGVLGVRHGRLPFPCRILRTGFNSVILRQIRDGWRRNSLAKISFVHSIWDPCASAPTSLLLNLVTSRVAHARRRRSKRGWCRSTESHCASLRKNCRLAHASKRALPIPGSRAAASN
jgi:hypothetical protein